MKAVTKRSASSAEMQSGFLCNSCFEAGAELDTDSNETVSEAGGDDNEDDENKREPAGLAVLETHLDFMVKYLELGGDKLLPETKSAVLKLIRQAMSWKESPRTASEIHEKIEELSTQMMKITGQS